MTLAGWIFATIAAVAWAIKAERQYLDAVERLQIAEALLRGQKTDSSNAED